MQHEKLKLKPQQDLKKFPQKKLGPLAINKKSTDPLVARVSAKSKYILALYIYVAVEEHYNRKTK